MGTKARSWVDVGNMACRMGAIAAIWYECGIFIAFKNLRQATATCLKLTDRGLLNPHWEFILVEPAEAIILPYPNAHTRIVGYPIYRCYGAKAEVILQYRVMTATAGEQRGALPPQLAVLTTIDTATTAPGRGLGHGDLGPRRRQQAPRMLLSTLLQAVPVEAPYQEQVAAPHPNVLPPPEPPAAGTPPVPPAPPPPPPDPLAADPLTDDPAPAPPPTPPERAAPVRAAAQVQARVGHANPSPTCVTVVQTEAASTATQTV